MNTGSRRRCVARDVRRRPRRVRHRSSGRARRDRRTRPAGIRCTSRREPSCSTWKCRCGTQPVSPVLPESPRTSPCATEPPVLALASTAGATELRCRYSAEVPSPWSMRTRLALVSHGFTDQVTRRLVGDRREPTAVVGAPTSGDQPHRAGSGGEHRGSFRQVEIPGVLAVFVAMAAAPGTAVAERIDQQRSLHHLEGSATRPWQPVAGRLRRPARRQDAGQERPGESHSEPARRTVQEYSAGLSTSSTATRSPTCSASTAASDTTAAA